MKSVIKKLVDRQPITAEESTESMKLIMSGEATEAQIVAFIMGLRLTGETPEIIAACAEVMRAHATPIPCTDPTRLILSEPVEMARILNISTTVAFVIAGAGVTVAKHGSYGVSSRCGAATFLINSASTSTIPPTKWHAVSKKLASPFCLLLHSTPP